MIIENWHAIKTIQSSPFPDQPDEPFALPSDFPGIIVGSAIIVPSSTLQDPPSLDIKGIQANVSASIGRTAFLECKVKNLGHKSVSRLFSKLLILVINAYDMMSKNGHFPRKLKKSKLANWPNHVTQQHHWLSCKITMHTELHNVKNIFPFYIER